MSSSSLKDTYALAHEHGECAALSMLLLRRSRHSLACAITAATVYQRLFLELAKMGQVLEPETGVKGLTRESSASFGSAAGMDWISMRSDVSSC